MTGCPLPWLLLLLFLAAAPAASSPQQAAHATAGPAVTLAQARQLREEHKGDQAAALLQNYLASHVDADALTLLAEIRLDAGDWDDAHRILVQALSADPNSPAANRLAGTMLFSAKQYPEAMDRFETVLRVLPKDPEARHMELDAALQLATQAQTAGNQEAALRVLEHARNSLPDDPELLLKLGMEAFDLNHLNEAAEALQEARKLSPGSPEILYGAARVELEQRQMPAAETDMRSYLALRPVDASAHFGLGHIYAMEQKSDAARAEFERSAQLQPVQTESYYQIGQLDLNLHQDQQADPLFQKVLSRDPNHGGALTGLGEIAFRAKKYTTAKGYLVRAVKAAPDYAPAHMFYGLTLLRLGEKAEGDKELQLAVKLGHDSGTPPGEAATPAQP